MPSDPAGVASSAVRAIVTAARLAARAGLGGVICLRRLVRAPWRWSAAVVIYLAVFAVCWWVWEAFKLPPAGSGRLGVAPAVGAAVSAALSGPVFYWAGRKRPPSGRGAVAWVSQVPAVPGWVDRGELADVVSALTGAGSGAVALTTGLVGAGGFGKTTLAAKACQDRRVRRRFGGGIVWITVGRDTDGPGLAARISEVIAAGSSGRGPAFTSPEQAGRALAGSLSGRGRVLLVADDVWTAAQLEPFIAAGQPWRLLVTTRRPAVLEDVAAWRIRVDAMPDRGCPGAADPGPAGDGRRAGAGAAGSDWPVAAAAEPGQPPPGR